MGSITPDQALMVADELRGELLKYSGIKVVDRTEMRAKLEEFALLGSGLCDDTECTVQVGKLISAEKMIAGNVYLDESSFIIQARIIDVTTSQIERYARVTLEESRFSLGKAIEITPSLVRQLLEVEQPVQPVVQRPTRAPNPTTGNLVLLSEPVSVVYLNSNRQGITPLNLVLDPDLYEIVFESANADYQSESRQVRVFAGFRDTIAVRLTLIPGRYTIITDQPAVTVYLDGLVQGTTPKTLFLYPGTHEVRLERTGYQTVTHSIEAFANSGGTIAIQMPPLPALLSVNSRPYSAKIWIDSDQETITLGNGTSYNIGGTLRPLRAQKVH